VKKGGSPYADEINALSPRMRRYIAWLETDADPSGTVRSECYLRTELVPALEAKVLELQAEIRSLERNRP
jgi:hypothetical protein